MGTDRERPILTISLLTSNRPKTVRKCLESLTPLRQAIPCELIITDTSKSPVIREIIEEYADRIYEFEWCNDFSKARNLGLSKASGEWFLYVDDDEWFDDDMSEMIEFFRSGEYKDYGYANYKTRDYIDPGLNYYSDTWASRMIRIDPDTHFKSKIHEHFEPVRGKLKSLNCHTHHVGYIYKSHEDLMKHFHRNEPLLREMMEEEPDNLRWQIQLVQEYRNIKDWNKVCDFCETQLQKNRSVDNKYDNIHLGTLYAGYAEALVFQKNYVKCIEICDRGLTDKRSTEATKAYLHLKLVEAYFWLEDIEKTKQYLDIYFKESKELPVYKETWVEQNVALLVNEVFDETNTKKAYSILIGCDLKEGSTKKLQEYYDKLEWKRQVIYVYDNIEKVFIETMSKLPYEPIFSEVITDILKNTELKRLVIEEVQKYELEDTQGFMKLAQVFANAESEEWFIWYARIWLGHKNKDIDAMRAALEGFYKVTPNVLATPKRLAEITEALGIKFSDYWKQISAEKWKNDVKEYLRIVKPNQLEIVIQQMKDAFVPDEWRNVYFELGLMERNISFGPKSTWQMYEYLDVLKQYAECMIQFYGAYYVDEAFMNYPEVLPKNLQAAIKFMEFVELEKQDGAQALHILREGANLYPEFSDGIRKFMEYYPELEKQKEETRRKELLQLRDQVMAQVKELLEKGQVQEAAVIIQQLKQMMPDDLDVIALGLEVRLKSL